MKNYMKCNKGITLVEIIVSIALLGIFAVASIPIFSISARVMNVTNNKLESTYVGKNTMELVYNISKTAKNYNDFQVALINEGYVKDGDKFKYYSSDDKYIELSVDIQANLVKVFILIYINDSETLPESQYEAYYILNM